MLAVGLELTVSANLLTLLGIPYVADGGSLLVKLHPGTDLLILSFCMLIVRTGGWLQIVSDRMLAGCLCLISASLFYSLMVTGTGNLIVLLDTFLPAGLLMAVLSSAQRHQLLQLRLLMQSLFTANALLALAETAAHATLIPLYLDNYPYHPHNADFRPTALFDHPLTGSVMALLGLALAPNRIWLRLMYCGLMWAALLAYGGRVAILAALLMTCGAHSAQSMAMILRRHPQAARRIWATSIAALCMASIGVIAIGAGLETRLAAHLYWDESAQVRLVQWQLLECLDRWQLIFGARRADLIALLVPLRLGPGVEVIENFWLLMFASLGFVGFPLFFGAVLALVSRCWRASLLHGRLLVTGVLLVASTSNSIGRKSTILVCMVATVACLPARKIVHPRRSAAWWEGYRFAVAV